MSLVLRPRPVRTAARTPTVRRLAACAVAVFALLLSGCAGSVAQSRVTEYATDGHELVTQILASIPEELDAQPAPPMIEIRDGGPGIETAGDSVWWQYEQDVELAAEPEASERAAEAVTRALQADGWEVRRIRETEQGQRIADGFRRSVDDTGWYIELTFVRAPVPTAQRIELILVSPPTVRGEPDADSSPGESSKTRAIRMISHPPSS